MHNLADKPLAIVGMACRLPGADDLEQFWQLLIEGRSNLGELPRDRFKRELHFHPDKGQRTKSYTSIGGVANHLPFDRDLNPLPQELIDRAHQAHLTFFEVAASACRDAGWDPFNLQTRRAGVYTGHTPPCSLGGNLTFARQVTQTAQYLREVPDFGRMPLDEQNDIIREIIAKVRGDFSPDDKSFDTQANAFHAAALVAEGMKLDGPAMSFDAACASGMRALGHGVRALQLGQIDMAIIGGASTCHCDTLILFSQAQSVSTTQSRPFDTDADGLVASEGYVVLVLKTLEQALADGDDVKAVIRGIGISSDGKGKSLWAPREEGQVEAIRRAYGDGLAIEDLQYIEMHATSTQVGDATELGALSTVFADRIPAGMKFPVGSVKANVGHTLETAGLASLCKTVLAMRHGVIPPQINVTTLNEKIDWPNIPFYIPQEALAWPEPVVGKPRRAAVNAFGIGGLNVHVVLDQYTPAVHDSMIAPKSTVPVVQSMVDEPIAIIGMGAVFPGAHTIDALLDVLRDGSDQKHPIADEAWTEFVDVDSPEERQWRVPTRHGGFCDDFVYDWKKHRVPPKQIAGADPLQFMLLDAADQAIRDAGYMDKEFDHLRTGVIVGTIFGGAFTDKLQMGLRLPEFKVTLTEVLAARGVSEAEIEQVYEQYENVLLKHAPALIDETGSFTSSTLASRITKTFNLMGGAVAVDAGDASAFSALNSCVDLLRAGDCDMMLCAAGQMALTSSTYQVMAKNGFLADGKSSTAFDASSTGCEPGEGVGVVILKRLSDAQRDGDRIHAIIRGLGVARDNSLENSVRSAIERGLADANVRSNEVALVEAGAIGVLGHDMQEIDGVVGAFGNDSREVPLLVGAASSQFGYTGGVSGMAALMKSIAELNAVSMAKGPGLEQPAESIASQAAVLSTALVASQLPALNDDGRVIAGVNSYSQFNTAYHLVVEGMTKVPRLQSAPAPSPVVEVPVAVAISYRIARIGASSIAELKDLAAQAANQSAALYEASASSSFSPDQKHRLAVVCDSVDALAQKLTLAAKQLDRPEARSLLGEKGIFVGEVGSRAPRIAFVFPGQGSQYEGMLKQLVAEFPPAAAALRNIDNVFQQLGLPTFAQLAWGEGEPFGNEVWRTQLSLLAANTVMYASALAMGLKPDRVAGHSFGELVALYAAGSWDFESAVRAACARCAAIDGCQNANGALLSTSAPADVLHRLCEEVGGAVYVSHYNAPDQTVAGGEEEAIALLAKIVEREGHKSLILDVPAAFHTVLMAEVQEPFRNGLAELTIEPPTIPILSSVTNRYVADPADIRDNLVVQMTQPVRYADLVERLAAEGINAFVEIGPRQVLTGLNRRTLGDAGPALVSCDHSKRQGLQQLMFARACVETTGALDAASAPHSIASIAMTSPAVAANVPAIDEPQVVSAVEEAKPETPSVSAEHAPAALNVLRLEGTPYDMGKQHGRAHAAEIRQILRRYADLVGTKWDQFADLDAAVAEPRAYFGESDLQELKGIADGAGVALAAIIAHNLRLYLDAGSGGLHFAVSAESNPGEGMLHAANEDLLQGMSVRDCLARNIQVRVPANGIPHITFCVVGQLGGLNGINAAGIAVSTSSMIDSADEAKCPQGTLHTILVKNILENATDIDAAVEIIRRLHGQAAFSLCLSQHAADRICYVEYDGRNLKVLPSTSTVVAANHSVLKNFDGHVSAPEPSRLRLNRLKDLLGGDQISPLTVSKAQRALRDRFDLRHGHEAEHPTASTVQRVDNQISLIMQPAMGNLWVTAGPLSNGHKNQFALLNLNELLPATPGGLANSPATTHSTEQPPSVIQPSELAGAYAAAEQALANDANPTVCCRYVMRIVEQPLELAPNATLPLYGAALILGTNAVAEALGQTLLERGVEVYQLPSGSTDEVLASIDATFALTACPHLFITTACDADAVTALDCDTWNHRRELGAMLPYLVAQRWFQKVIEAGLLDSASIAAVTTMGGDFGFSGELKNIESGTLTGLLKGIALELEIGRAIKTFNMKLVDVAPTTAAAEVADLICLELAASDGEKEVGYRDGRRYVVRPVPMPIDESTCSDIPAGAPFVITGGARGVTAVVARELGRRFGVAMHLIGSSPLPEIADAYHTFSEADMKEVRAVVMKEALSNGEKPAEAWERFEKALEIDKTLRSFAAEGIRAVYHACDVSDRAALAKLLDSIRATDGPIQGVIHGAGFERAASFEKKNPQLVSRTIAAKVDGAAALMELTRRDPLKYFAAFGSVSGRFGGVGQTDYCTANEMLAKLINWYRQERPECRSAVFHWHAWDDVGMAVRPESKHIRKLHNINFMPSAEGAAHLVNELRAGLPEGEIVITELAYCKQKYADALAAAEGTPETDPVGPLPMINAVIESTPSESLIAGVELNPTADVFLVQHRYKGAPMMPVVMTLETMAEAASLAAGGKQVAELKNIEIVNGLRFLSDATQSARVRAVVDGSEVTCEFTSDFHNRMGKLLLKDKPYLRCAVETTDEQSPLHVESHGRPSQWTECWYPEEDVVIWHGPEFRCLRQIAVEEDRGWGKLVAPAIGNLGGSRTGSNWKIPAALLDSCFFACGVYLWFRCAGVVAIPAGIDRIRLGRQPRTGENCIVEIGYRGREGDQGIFDFIIFGDDNTAILHLEGYRNIIVSEAPAPEARATV